jgi:membrane protein YdbS with pleckstrin-like domain
MNNDPSSNEPSGWCLSVFVPVVVTWITALSAAGGRYRYIGGFPGVLLAIVFVVLLPIVTLIYCTRKFDEMNQQPYNPEDRND